MDEAVPSPPGIHPTHEDQTWRTELRRWLAPAAFPCTSEDATACLLRAHAPSGLVWRVGLVPAQMRFASLDLLIAGIDAHSPRQRPSSAMSDLDVKNAHDIALQQIIDDLTRDHLGQEHERVVLELAEKIAEHQLAPKPRPWLDAVADSVISGNAYVVTQTTAEICDVPPPSSRHPGKSIL